MDEGGLVPVLHRVPVAAVGLLPLLQFLVQEGKVQIGVDLPVLFDGGLVADDGLLGEAGVGQVQCVGEMGLGDPRR
ncbi:hypothetical protein AB0L85_29415 [Streptomyces sp. NPDC052051]|uniref:hypothetical protein n=1 Tax=Streptomyces sp. NPDC052051 TaxID=3154649 RepID=UPI003420415C